MNIKKRVGIFTNTGAECNFWFEWTALLLVFGGLRVETSTRTPTLLRVLAVFLYLSRQTLGQYCLK
jgi:hypothetical protein